MNQKSVVDLFKQIAGNEFGFFSQLKHISEIMDPEIPTVSCDLPFGQFIGRRPVKSNATHAVIDPDDGEIIGVLKQSTIFRCYPRFMNTLAMQDEDEKILENSISTMVTRPIPLMAPDASPIEALNLLIGQDCDCIFIGHDQKEIQGVVRPIDFVNTLNVFHRICSRKEPLQRLRLIDLDEMPLDEVFIRGAQTARDAMIPIATMDESESVLTAIKLMWDQQMPTIGLVDGQSSDFKILTVDDILLGLKAPTDLRNLVEDTQETDLNCAGRLRLIPWETMCDSKDPVLREAAKSIAGSDVLTVDPKIRLSEVSPWFIKASENRTVCVQDNRELTGVFTVREMLRIFKTLMRIQTWTNGSDNDDSEPQILAN